MERFKDIHMLSDPIIEEKEEFELCGKHKVAKDAVNNYIYSWRSSSPGPKRASSRSKSRKTCISQYDNPALCPELYNNFKLNS
jgi:hypothetical protein